MRFIGAAFIVLYALILAVPLPAQQQPAPVAQAPAAPALTISTIAWPDGDDIPLKYTQAVPNPVSPALTWTNVPAGTRSFVLHFHDPDVSINKTMNTQVHWLVWNIPGTATGLAEGAPQGPQLPDGSRQVSASGQVYRGPGARAAGPKHHYTFELYALDTLLDVPHGANEQDTRAAVIAAMNGHIIGKAVYAGLFKRPQ
ncbi:MAG TPA: YbhB/YbcL family Raf kinase inhibitor-like protein [Vicinamibacterales bacterium]|nr:YbhB/YbcL family Raf kinase inhibitor-like protein [Vicinamibacterales bacterium]